MKRKAAELRHNESQVGVTPRPLWVGLRQRGVTRWVRGHHGVST